MEFQLFSNQIKSNKIWNKGGKTRNLLTDYAQIRYGRDEIDMSRLSMHVLLMSTLLPFIP